MALQGTLEDFSIVELLQFPFASKKTGRLVITAPDSRTETVFYREGKPIHAECGDLEPFEAIVELVGWTRGEFQFFPEEQTGEQTLELDLHRLLMQALKVRDERTFLADLRRREAERKGEAPPAEQFDPATLQSLLTELAEKLRSAHYICIMDGNKQIIAELKIRHPDRDWVNWSGKAAALFADPPRSAVHRMMMEDDDGVILLQRITPSLALALAADATQAPGAMMVTLGKAIARMQGKS